MCSVDVVELTTQDLEDIRTARDLLATGEAQRLREAANLTRAEVAAHADSSTDAVALWESGQRCPRTEPALRLGRLYRELTGKAATS